MKARVYVTLKQGLLDAQGKTIKAALESLGFKGVSEVRVGKLIEVELDRSLSAGQAKQTVERMCRKLLANPVVEQYRIDIVR